jgi:hypothetical protein
MRHPRNATRFPVLRYSELNRRLQLRAVFQRIQGLRKSIDSARQERRQLENVLVGRTGGGA